MTTPQIFVSHNHNDNNYCRTFVAALREGMGDDKDAVWYDEHNLGWGALQQVIDQELLKRQHFIAILSPTAVASDWVKTEIYAALDLLRKGKMRTFQLVVAASCDVSEVSPTLGGYKRIEQAGGAPFPPGDAARRALAVITEVHGDQQPTSPPPRDTLPLLGPAPAPTNSTSMHELPPARLRHLGFRGYLIQGVKCIMPPICPVPGGRFTMGSSKSMDPEATDDDLPQHLVEVSPFAIAQHPVTVIEYAYAVQAGAVRLPSKSILSGPTPETDWGDQQAHLDHPIVCIRWNEAIAYVQWLSEITQQPWRLPNEAEWEKAARGTDGRTYPWGDEFDRTCCNVLIGQRGIDMTMPVGAYPHGESPYHTQDMAGNVWEWTSSLYMPYPYQASDGRENLEVSGSRVMRGGSWASTYNYSRTTCRFSGNPNAVHNYNGFRLVLAYDTVAHG